MDSVPGHTQRHATDTRASENTNNILTIWEPFVSSRARLTTTPTLLILLNANWARSEGPNSRAAKASSISGKSTW